jgi:DNA-directed RNA polymerase specialized sigma24 family protein
LELRPKAKRPSGLMALLRQANNNNREALDELFALCRSRLYNQALRVLRNSKDAEDALQDGLLYSSNHSRMPTYIRHRSESAGRR